jgi:subtilisin family serine protease
MAMTTSRRVLCALAAAVCLLAAPSSLGPHGGDREGPFLRFSAVYPNDPQLVAGNGFWPLEALRLPDAWELSTGGAGTLVAIVDTGTNDVPDLQGAIAKQAATEGQDLRDNRGHGTPVAGLVLARGNNAIGTAGVCWTCSMTSYKVTAPPDENKAPASAVAKAIDLAVADGARVINLSLAGPAADVLAAAISRALAADVVVVAAAGNQGSSDPSYPAAYPGVLSVAALDQRGERASFSSYGPWVRVAAPGCGVSTNADGTYGTFCGTSAAAPWVAGVAALIRARRPDLSAQQVVSAIEESARPLASSEVVARGAVDARAALELAGVRPLQSERQQRPAASLRVLRQPTLLGEARVGGRLIVDVGRYSQPPSAISIRWQRCPRAGVAGCRPLVGSRLSYTVGLRDLGFRLRAQVTVVADGQTLTLLTKPRLVRGR